MTMDALTVLGSIVSELNLFLGKVDNTITDNNN